MVSGKSRADPGAAALFRRSRAPQRPSLNALLSAADLCRWASPMYGTQNVARLRESSNVRGKTGGVMLRALSLLLVAVSVASCGTLPPQEATTSEVHSIRAAADSSKTITVSDGMVFYNSSHTAGIRFPPGTYTLEADDDDFWYF